MCQYCFYDAIINLFLTFWGILLSLVDDAGFGPATLAM